MPIEKRYFETWEHGQLMASGISEHRTGEDKCPGCAGRSVRRAAMHPLRLLRVEVPLR
jgi:hypothetical protein